MTEVNVSETQFKEYDKLASDIFVGCLFIATAGASLLLYIPILVISCISKDLKSPCYTFIISLGISDCVSLSGWIVIGIETLTHSLVLSRTLLTVTLCVLVIGWGSLTIHLAVIAFSRYIAVCHPNLQANMFSNSKVIILLAFCWIYAIFVHATPTFLPPNMYYSLDGYYATWANDFVTKYYTVEDITCCLLVFMTCTLCYIAIIVKYAQVRSKIVSKIAVVPVFASKERTDIKRQFKLALQTCIRCITFIVYDLLYYIVSLYSTNVWAVFICSTYLWCLNNAINPWIYIIFNEQLRKAFKDRIMRTTV